MRTRHLGPLVALLLLAPTASSEAPLPNDGWPRAAPAGQGLDPQRLTELVRLIEAGARFPNLHSLLIVKHGHLVLEEYFDGWRADRLHTLQSVTKSFTSALVGIALERGEIGSIEDTVLSFFPDLRNLENVDDRKRAMTLEDLLTMRGGTDYHERGANSPHSTLNSMAHAWDRFYLERPMARRPGTTFQYDSGGVILMSAILKRRAGMHADAYAEHHLFEPLGIERATWFRNRDGHPHTGGGLDLLPRDMAKFGLLYLRGGRWGDRQVVPAEWVERSTWRHVRRGGSAGHGVGYGYLWWILEPDPAGAGQQDIYAAMGFRAQYIFVVPEHDMVVVVTGGTRQYRDEQRPISFLYSHILPAVQRILRPEAAIE